MFGRTSYQNRKVIFPFLKFDPNNVCEICQMGKQTRKSLRKEKARDRSKTLLENVRSDVNELPIRSIDGENYFVTFIEESTHFTNVFLLKQKSEGLKYYKHYLNRMISITNRPGIANLYCNNGGEYTSKEFDDYVASLGTNQKKTIGNTSALNGVAERMNRTLMNKARALLFQAGLPAVFWNFAVLVAAYIINCIPTKALSDTRSPFVHVNWKSTRL